MNKTSLDKVNRENENVVVYTIFTAATSKRKYIDFMLLEALNFEQLTSSTGLFFEAEDLNISRKHCLHMFTKLNLLRQQDEVRNIPCESESSYELKQVLFNFKYGSKLVKWIQYFYINKTEDLESALFNKRREKGEVLKGTCLGATLKLQSANPNMHAKNTKSYDYHNFTIVISFGIAFRSYKRYNKSTFSHISNKAKKLWWFLVCHWSAEDGDQHHKPHCVVIEWREGFHNRRKQEEVQTNL
uniref:Uncharacterized protein n=1 Tax=Glossina austeni TaxID=7395 RepID=A0A1A9VRI1_GLOAU